MSSSGEDLPDLKELDSWYESASEEELPHEREDSPTVIDTSSCDQQLLHQEEEPEPDSFDSMDDFDNATPLPREYAKDGTHKKRDLTSFLGLVTNLFGPSKRSKVMSSQAGAPKEHQESQHSSHACNPQVLPRSSHTLCQQDLVSSTISAVTSSQAGAPKGHQESYHSSRPCDPQVSPTSSHSLGRQTLVSSTTNVSRCSKRPSEEKSQPHQSCTSTFDVSAVNSLRENIENDNSLGARNSQHAPIPCHPLRPKQSPLSISGSPVHSSVTFKTGKPQFDQLSSSAATSQERSKELSKSGVPKPFAPSEPVKSTPSRGPKKPTSDQACGSEGAQHSSPTASPVPQISPPAASSRVPSTKSPIDGITESSQTPSERQKLPTSDLAIGSQDTRHKSQTACPDPHSKTAYPNPKNSSSALQSSTDSVTVSFNPSTTLTRDLPTAEQAGGSKILQKTSSTVQSEYQIFTGLGSCPSNNPPALNPPQHPDSRFTTPNSNANPPDFLTCNPGRKRSRQSFLGKCADLFGVSDPKRPKISSSSDCSSASSSDQAGNLLLPLYNPQLHQRSSGISHGLTPPVPPSKSPITSADTAQKSVDHFQNPKNLFNPFWSTRPRVRTSKRADDLEAGTGHSSLPPHDVQIRSSLSTHASNGPRIQPPIISNQPNSHHQLSRPTNSSTPSRNSSTPSRSSSTPSRNSPSRNSPTPSRNSSTPSRNSSTPSNNSCIQSPVTLSKEIVPPKAKQNPAVSTSGQAFDDSRIEGPVEDRLCATPSSARDPERQRERASIDSQLLKNTTNISSSDQSFSGTLLTDPTKSDLPHKQSQLLQPDNEIDAEPTASASAQQLDEQKAKNLSNFQLLDTGTTKVPSSHPKSGSSPGHQPRHTRPQHAGAHHTELQACHVIAAQAGNTKPGEDRDGPVILEISNLAVGHSAKDVIVRKVSLE